MLHAFLLSGDYPEIARAEIEYLLCLTNPKKVGRILLYQGYIGENVKRLALTREVVKVFSLTSLDELENAVEELAEYLSLTLAGCCCVRVKCFSPGSMRLGIERITKKTEKNEVSREEDNVCEKIDKTKLEKELGSILWRKGLKISVSSPDEVVRIYVFPDSTVVVGLLVHKLDTKQFSRRHPERRPFFRPGVMLPKLCRALVNISTPKGAFLDPMCGTGGLVIEASLLGLKAIGVELYPKIVRGCKDNLKTLAPKAEIVCGNATQLPLKRSSVDGVATDFPYFQSSKSLYSREELLISVSDELCRVMKEGKRAVVVTNCEFDFPMKILEIFNIKVHSSLTRRIYILENS